MGKKKPQKKKEISVAIAEASSKEEDETQQQPPRKRGRPRKIIQNNETEGIKEENQKPEEVQSKKYKSSFKEEIKEEVEAPSGGKKKEEVGLNHEVKEAPRRSRRRKNKPRKSC